VRTVTYALRFERAHKDEPTIATGLVTVTSLSSGEVPVETTRTALSGQASYHSDVTLDSDGTRFTEKGVITFGEAAGAHTLAFSTLGYGYLVKSKEQDTSLTPGAVMWNVDSGTGFFEGASGVISSNFRVNPHTEQLIDDQLGFIQLPEAAS
jgi:hypothetical protein